MPAFCPQGYVYNPATGVCDRIGGGGSVPSSPLPFPQSGGVPAGGQIQGGPVVGGGNAGNVGGGGGGGKAPPPEPACACGQYFWSLSDLGGTSGIPNSGTYAQYVQLWNYFISSGLPDPAQDLGPPVCTCMNQQQNPPGGQGGPAPSNPGTGGNLPPPATPPCNTCGSQTSGGTCPSCTGSSIDSACQGLADTVQQLLAQLANKTSGACDVSSDCMDSLVQKVIDKLSEPTMTCASCCSAIQSGTQLETSQALECAALECQCIQQTCSPGQPETWGGPCSGCGQEPCCCNEGVCEPCEEGQQQQSWEAWCNDETGQILSQSAGSPGLLLPWVLVGVAASQSAADLMAANQCGQQRTSQAVPAWQIPQPGSVNSSVVCDINTWASGGSIGNYLNSLHPANLSVLATNVFVGAAEGLGNLAANAPIIGPFLQNIAQGVGSPLIVAPLMAPAVANMLGCSNGPTADALVQLMFLGIAGEASGTDFSQFAAPLRYAVNASCPNKHLEPERAIAAWLADTTGTFDVNTHFAIGGYCPQATEWYKYAARSKLVPDQITELVNRGYMPQADGDSLLQGLGYKDQSFRDAIFSLSKVYPPYSDIVRMMVRDAADQSLVDRFALDTDFTQKYQGQLKQWAAGQGISDQIMQYLWRAHWSIPAVGQLYEMYHRLRDPNVAQANDPIYQDVVTAMEQQDIAPYWIPRLLQIAFKPLTRIDVRRAYQIGAVDDDTVKQSLRNLGYDDANVAIMFAFMQKLRDQGAATDRVVKLWTQFRIDYPTALQRMSAKGYSQAAITQALLDSELSFTKTAPAAAFVAGEIISADLRNILGNQGVSPEGINTIVAQLGYVVKWHSAVEQYDAGLVTRADAENQMIADGIQQARANRWLTTIDNKLDVQHSKQCQANVQRRFKYGEIGTDDITKILGDQGIVEERAESLADWWGCQVVTDTRHITANRLCGWLNRGAIAPQDFISRLQKIGYSNQDAMLMLADCAIKFGNVTAAQQLKQAKAEASAIQKAERLAARQASEVVRLQKQAAELNRRNALARNRREEQLLSSAHKVMAKCDCDSGTAIQTVQQCLASVRSTYGLSPDEGLQALIQSVEAWPGGDPSTLCPLLDQLGSLVSQESGVESELSQESPVQIIG